MSHTHFNNSLPAWSVENSKGYGVSLLPCACCGATSLEVRTGEAVIEVRLDGLGTLEALRDALAAAVEFQTGRPAFDPDAEGGCQPRQWRGHAPAAVRAAFDGWLDDWPGVTRSPEEMDVFWDGLLPSLSLCTDLLPPHHCLALGLPVDSTYADAVEAVTDLLP